MNKTKIYIYSLLIAATSLNIGCVSTMSDGMSDAYNSIKSPFNSKNTPAGTDALYAQVNQQDKERVDQLQHELEVTKQTRVLASLTNKRDNLQQKRSSLNDKRMKIYAQEKNYRVDLAKLEAIDKNKLGDKITNIEAIADVHVDALETQQKRLKLDSEIGVLDVHIEKLQNEIDTQQIKIDNLNPTTTSKAITQSTY